VAVVIEHTFVTTKDADAALQAAGELLGARGFVHEPAAGQPPRLAMRRGKPSAAKAKSIAELPQTAHVQFDRGRVTVVLSIEPSAAFGGASSWAMHSGPSEGDPKKMKLHTELLTAVANALEAVVAQGHPRESATAEWDRVDVAIAEGSLKRKRDLWIVLLVVVLIVVVVAVVAVFAT
jgi:hypothetical protein